MSEIWLIRHGESESNAGMPTCDTANIAVTARGFAQAAAVAAAFERSPALIVASPYLRARQSAQPTIERFPNTRVEIWPVFEFTYLSRSNRHNTTRQQRRPQVDGYWNRCDPTYFDGDGAETFSELVMRVKQAIERIQQVNDDFVAIFSHGTFIRALIWTHLANPGAAVGRAHMQQFRNFLLSFDVPNTSILKLYVHSKRELSVSTLSVAHLPVALHYSAVREL